MTRKESCQMDYSNYFLKPQRKYVVRRFFLYLFVGVPFAWLLLKALSVVITFMLYLGVF